MFINGLAKESSNSSALSSVIMSSRLVTWVYWTTPWSVTAIQPRWGRVMTSKSHCPHSPAASPLTWLTLDTPHCGHALSRYNGVLLSYTCSIIYMQPSGSFNQWVWIGIMLEMSFCFHLNLQIVILTNIGKWHMQKFVVIQKSFMELQMNIQLHLNCDGKKVKCTILWYEILQSRKITNVGNRLNFRLKYGTRHPT